MLVSFPFSSDDHVAFSCDVSKEHEVQKTFGVIQKSCGNITYLVNAAGINMWASTLADISYYNLSCLNVLHKWLYNVWFPCLFRDALLLRTRPEDMVSVLHTNLLGTMLTCRAALRSMLQAKDAAIVNIGTTTYCDWLCAVWTLDGSTHQPTS